MKTARRVCSLVVFGLIIMVGFDARAAVVSYTLDQVNLEDGTQMTGTFSWSYDVGDFENGRRASHAILPLSSSIPPEAIVLSTSSGTSKGAVEHDITTTRHSSYGIVGL